MAILGRCSTCQPALGSVARPVAPSSALSRSDLQIRNVKSGSVRCRPAAELRLVVVLALSGPKVEESSIQGSISSGRSYVFADDELILRQCQVPQLETASEFRSRGDFASQE